jgi:hypothetical protein
MSDFLKSLMTNENIPLINEGENVYAISILSKGENLFFRENDKGLICSIDAVHGAILKDSIKVWDTHNKKMSNEEKERVLGLILKYYKERLNPNAVIYLLVRGRWQPIS